MKSIIFLALVLSAVTAFACDSQTNTSECLAPTVPPVVVVVPQPLGGKCTSHSGCQGDLYCFEGYCCKLGQKGDPCYVNANCFGDLGCQNGRCNPLGKEGEYTPALMGAHAWSCCIGDPCTHNDFCYGTLACINNQCCPPS